MVSALNDRTRPERQRAPRGRRQWLRRESHRTSEIYYSDLLAVAVMSDGGAFSGPARVPRGTAPAGAFNIPEEGATVPKNLSFLERYRKNGFEEPSREIPATEPVSQSAPASANVTGANINAKLPVSALASAVADLTTKETLQDEDINKKEADQPAKIEAEVAADDKATQPEPRFEVSPAAQDDAERSKAKDANDDGQVASLCFPALRLCANSALVDRAQLEALVSSHILSVTFNFIPSRSHFMCSF